MESSHANDPVKRTPPAAADYVQASRLPDKDVMQRPALVSMPS